MGISGLNCRVIRNILCLKFCVSRFLFFVFGFVYFVSGVCVGKSCGSNDFYVKGSNVDSKGCGSKYVGRVWFYVCGVLVWFFFIFIVLLGFVCNLISF